jgi:predicted RNA-binding protein YlxR (DUF448 family)
VPKKKARKRKHIPQRTCVGCRQVNPKKTLTRIVRTADGVRIDPDGKMAGRGAYLHNTAKCWQLGLEKSLARALKTEITAEEMAVLEEYSQTLAPETEDITTS